MGYLREANQILSVLWGQYQQFEPKGIYRRYSINADIYSVLNFEGDQLGNGLEWNANMDLKNYWRVFTGGSFRGNNLDQSILRGGPMMKTPGRWDIRFGFSTDSRKKLVFDVYSNFRNGYSKSSKSFYSEGGFSYKPTNYLVLSFNPSYSKSFSEIQYVSTINQQQGDKFIFAGIDRETVSASFRINVNLSPDLTLQYWGQPFIATGAYNNHKQIVNPKADNFDDRFRIFTPSQISLNDDEYLIDENGDSTTDYRFDRKDFNFKEFLSNLVLRWEYSPGSSVFLVWNQSRSSSNNSGNLHLTDDLSDLFDGSNNRPHHVFLIKFSYRFGIK